LVVNNVTFIDGELVQGKRQIPCTLQNKKTMI